MISFETILANSSYFEKENLLFIRIKEEPELTLENVILSNEQQYAVLGERVVRTIVDVRSLGFAHISSEVLAYLADGPYNKYQESEAFIINGLGQKLIANFYLKVMKPNVKSSFFTNLDSALAWHDIESRNEIKLFLNEEKNDPV